MSSMKDKVATAAIATMVAVLSGEKCGDFMKVFESGNRLLRADYSGNHPAKWKPGKHKKANRRK